MNDELDVRVREWIARDIDPDTRAELRELLACRRCDDPAACRRASDELAERFDAYLTFGTAGLRGQLGAGPHRMNAVVIAHATVALARFIGERTSSASDGSQGIVVIAFDGREKSAYFARLAARIMVGAGFRALLSPTVAPTPVLAFAVKHLRADAGIMITASHNPRGDNGYKVYLGGEHGGRQLVAPFDDDIHNYMVESLESRSARDIPTGEPETLDQSVIEAYESLTASLVPEPIHDPRFVYTAMHGVGYATFTQVLRRAGFSVSSMTIVDEQVNPDSRFPTLPFPNPEEDGALTLACSRAREVGAELVLAHDPDADRLGVAIPDTLSQGGYRILTGNEIGILLGSWVAERAQQRGITVGSLACSIVSSPQLQRVATHFGYEFAWTLSGFKWISRVPNLLFGFEEALGFLVNPDVVHDKDGISAALAMLSLVSELHAEGKTIDNRLAEIDDQFGMFVSDAFSVRTSHGDIAEIMHGLRTSPPHGLANVAVTTVDDYSRDVSASGSQGSYLRRADVLALWLEDGSRVMFRPSGTESKLKVYVDVCEDSAPPRERRRIALARLNELTIATRALVS